MNSKDQHSEVKLDARVTVSLDNASLEILKQRQQQLRAQGLPVSLSSVAFEAINKGLKA